MKQRELYHRMTDDEKIPSCKVLTYALVAAIAVIVFIYVWCILPK